MVGPNKDLVLTALQVVAPNLKDFNDSQEFPIMDFVPRFSKNQFSGEKGYWILLANFEKKKIQVCVGHVP